MSKLAESQLDKMKHLIDYGKKKESVSVSAPIVEFHTKGADGRTYGIIRECNKFYIKVAPNKDTEVLAEDYDYLGGFMNRKENEYSSYAAASKNFDLKMMSLNEEFSATKVKLQRFIPVETSEWQVNETKEMRAEINRFNAIMNNVGYIMNENKEFTQAHTLPEAPAKNPSEKEVNSPFTDTAVANGDKDFKKEQTDPKKAGAPFNEKTEANMESDKNHTGKSEEVYSEKAKYVPENSVADKNPSGAKSVKMNECKTKRVLKLTEEQVLAWSKSKDFMDKSKGTEIGSSAPYTDELGCESNQCEADTEPIHESEGVAVHNTDNINSPKPGVGEIGDKAPFEENVNEDIVDINDVEGMDEIEGVEDNDMPFPGMDAEYNESDFDFEQEYNDWLNSQEMGNNDDDFDFDDDELSQDLMGFDPSYGIDDFNESKKVDEGLKLKDFGKHPAYHKKVMTTPPYKEVAPNGARDWNDDSAKSEQPFGKSKGNPAPYSEEVIDLLTDAIIESFLKNKKKV